MEDAELKRAFETARQNWKTRVVYPLVGGLTIALLMAAVFATIALFIKS